MLADQVVWTSDYLTTFRALFELQNVLFTAFTSIKYPASSIQHPVLYYFRSMKKLKLEELGRISVDQFKESRKLPVCLVLDNVRSLHNVGSAFRTADAFRLEKIFLTGITGTPPHREIQKTALGATESVDWVYAEHTAEALKSLRS